MGDLLSAARGLMDQALANKSHYYFEVQGLPAEALTVAGFESEDHGLSRDYRFLVDVIARMPVTLDRQLGATASLSLRWAGDHTRVHGVVSQIEQAGDTPDGPRYRFTLSSPLWPLTQTRHNRVFLNKTVSDIVTEVLETAGWPADAFEIKASGNYPPREFVAQYDESDYDFICRQLAYHGLFYTFEQGLERALLLIHDDVAALAARMGVVNLPYQVQIGSNRTSETCFSLARQVKVATASLRLKDYNDETPERSLLVDSRATGGGYGLDYRYGEHYGDDGEGTRLARMRQEAFDWQRDTVRAETDCRGFAPGMHLNLSRHPEPTLNGEWLVLAVEHHGDQRGALPFGPQAKGLTYANRLQLIRAGKAYRTPYEPLRRQIYGTFTARIEGDGGDYAYVDDHGRYRLCMPWDLSGAPKGEASRAIRLMQPYGGPDYGMHFPLHDGAEVVVSCVNGDIDRPIVLGTLSNTANPSPVNGANASQNILRTWGGNELLMEDRLGEERIELFTRERQNILSLDAKADAHQVRLASEQGEMELYAGKSMLIECGESQTVQVGADHEVTVEQAQRLMTKNAEIELQAATDLLFKAAENVRMTAETTDLELRAEQDVIVQAGRGLSVEVNNQNATILVEQGAFELQAKGAITFKGEGGGSIHIGQSGGSLEIADNGDLTIDAPKVEINAGSIAIKGQSVGNN